MLTLDVSRKRIKQILNSIPVPLYGSCVTHNGSCRVDEVYERARIFSDEFDKSLERRTGDIHRSAKKTERKLSCYFIPSDLNGYGPEVRRRIARERQELEEALAGGENPFRPKGRVYESDFFY